MNLADFVSLGALDQCGPCSGYDIIQELERRCIQDWTNIKVGSIYHALTKLKEAGKIEVVETLQDGHRPSKTIFDITEFGQAYFDEMQGTAFMGLFPCFQGFMLAMVFNKRRTASEVRSFCKQAIAVIDERVDGLDRHRQAQYSDHPKIQENVLIRVNHYLAHSIGLYTSEREWIQRVHDHIDDFDTTALEPYFEELCQNRKGDPVPT